MSLLKNFKMSVLSGFAKRKRKKEREIETRKIPKIDSFFKSGLAVEAIGLPTLPNKAVSSNVTNNPCEVEAISADIVEYRFRVLTPEYLRTASDNEIITESTVLFNKYSNDLTEEFRLQLLSFRSALRNEITEACSVFDLARLLIVDYSAVSSAFSEVCVAFMLFLTLPVTVATAERSFSKLKLIKSYLRNTMSQSRLHGLSLLSIEAARAKKWM